MNNARENILTRLRTNRKTNTPLPEAIVPEDNWEREHKITQISERMQAVHTEVHRIPTDGMAEWFQQQLPLRKLNRVLLGDNELANTIESSMPPSIQVTRYLRDIEEWKQELFQDIDAGITSTFGAIAETGSLILWPNHEEPRLMSLVPPMHIAVLKADDIYVSFAEAIDKQQWGNYMPANALLISGPSKTADIEQTLVYGVHGPRQLIVLILE